MDVTGAIPTGMPYGGYGWGNNGNATDTDAILRSLSDVRMENKESEAVVLRTISKEVSDSTYRLHDNIRNVADQILVSSNLTQAQVASSASALLLAGEKQTALILSAISATEMRQLQDELNETRLKNLKSESQLYATNQAINFGAGTIAAQTASSNQVR